jgi:hypothetical protein
MRTVDQSKWLPRAGVPKPASAGRGFSGPARAGRGERCRRHHRRGDSAGGAFSFRNANDAFAVNWGIAAVVYLFTAMLVVWLLGGMRRWRPRGQSSIRNQEVL